MKSLRTLTIVGCLIACSAPATSHAFAIAAGYTNWDSAGGSDGANLQLYPQWDVGFGLSPELQVGVHWSKTAFGTGTEHALYIPAMVGLRWDLGKVLPLGILGPFVGAHLGYARQEFIVTDTTLSDGSSGTNNFGFNFVAGLNFDLGNTVAIGVQGGADIIVANDAGEPQAHVYSVNAILTL